VCWKVEAFIPTGGGRLLDAESGWETYAYMNLSKLLIAPKSPVLSMNGRDLWAQSVMSAKHREGVNVTAVESCSKSRAHEVRSILNLLKPEQLLRF
jgi:hypothetical protein